MWWVDEWQTGNGCGNYLHNKFILSWLHNAWLRWLAARCACACIGLTSKHSHVEHNLHVLIRFKLNSIIIVSICRKKISTAMRCNAWHVHCPLNICWSMCQPPRRSLRSIRSRPTMHASHFPWKIATSTVSCRISTHYRRTFRNGIRMSFWTLYLTSICCSICPAWTCCRWNRRWDHCSRPCAPKTTRWPCNGRSKRCGARWKHWSRHRPVHLGMLNVLPFKHRFDLIALLNKKSLLSCHYQWFGPLSRRCGFIERWKLDM